MRALIDVDPNIVVWWTTRVETASVIARREHAGSLTSSDSTVLFRELDTLAATWLEVQPVAAIRPLARRLLRTHVLLAADALQLAAAIALVDGRPETAPFVSLDERLKEAARREGLVVIV
jgi:predicted nucleic acid-binding protein